MDYSTLSWFSSELGVEKSNFEDLDQCGFIDSFDEDLAALLGEEFLNLSPPSNCSSTLIRSSSNLRTSSCMEKNEVAIEPPLMKQKEPNNNNNFCRPKPHPAVSSSSTPIILNFGGANSPESPRPLNLSSLNHKEKAERLLRNPVEATKSAPTIKKTSRVRPPSQIYDHILAERKRREQLSQQFVALSTLLPGLKKRVHAIEEQSAKENLESVVLVKRSRVLMEEDEGSSYESNSSRELQLPEIKARVCNNLIQIRILSKKQKGVLLKVLCEVEKLNLSIVNIKATPFGNFALDITIVAEMAEESSLTLKEIVQILDSAFHRTA